MNNKKYLCYSLIILLSVLCLLFLILSTLFKHAFDKQLFKHEYYIKGIVLETLQEEADKIDEPNDEELLAKGPVVYYPYEGQLYKFEANN